MPIRQEPVDGDVILYCGADDASFQVGTLGETSRMFFTNRREAIRTARELAQTRGTVLWFVDATGLRSRVAPLPHRATRE